MSLENLKTFTPALVAVYLNVSADHPRRVLPSSKRSIGSSLLPKSQLHLHTPRISRGGFSGGYVPHDGPMITRERRHGGNRVSEKVMGAHA